MNQSTISRAIFTFRYHPPNKKRLQANRTKQRKCIILHSSYGLHASSINMTESMSFHSIICMSTICLYDDWPIRGIDAGGPRKSSSLARSSWRLASTWSQMLQPCHQCYWTTTKTKNKISFIICKLCLELFIPKYVNLSQYSLCYALWVCVPRSPSMLTQPVLNWKNKHTCMSVLLSYTKKQICLSSREQN
jgi:hypothetical protein